MKIYQQINGEAVEVDLSKISHVKDMFISVSSDNTKVNLYLNCNKGSEQAIFDSIPKWIHESLGVRKSHKHVFIELKK